MVAVRKKIKPKGVAREYDIMGVAKKSKRACEMVHGI